MRISQSGRDVDVYRRDGRRWHLDACERGERFRLESPGVELAVDEVYTDPLGAIVA